MELGFCESFSSSVTLSDRVCLRLAQSYLRAMDSHSESTNNELESALRMASATLKPEVVILLTPLVGNINSPDLRGRDLFDHALESAYHIRLRKLREWIENGIITQNQEDRRCHVTRLEAGPEILKSSGTS